jgi:SOS-response transcriptional repressor LexA
MRWIMDKRNSTQQTKEVQLVTSMVSDEPGTFGLKMFGDSMEPEFRDGDVLVFDHRIQPEPGDWVVVEKRALEFTVRKCRCGDTIFRRSIIGTLIEHRMPRRIVSGKLMERERMEFGPA